MKGVLFRSACLFVAACAGGNSAYSCSGYEGPFGTGALVIHSPNGGEELTGGELAVIEWEGGGGAAAVDIALYRGDAQVAVQREVPNVGSYGWRLPIDVPTAGDYWLEISALGVDMVAETDDVFTIRNWRMRREVIVTVPSGAPNGLAAVDFPADDEILQAAGNEGQEVRFAGDADRASGFDLAHWCEAWNAGGGKCWVQLPEGSSPTKSLFVFWDSPGALSTSSQATVMAGGFETTGDETLGQSDIIADVFIVHAGHTLTVAAGGALVVRAVRIEIAGTLDATGAGSAGGGLGLNAQGAGGGFGSGQAAGGGGAYGGGGGGGGHGPDEIAGSGGSPFGLPDDAEAAMGAGGGGGHSIGGGAGGGRIELHGTYVKVDGAILADGVAGPSAAGECGGGGGAGGGIMVSGRSLDMTGTLSASGGDGGDGVPATDHHGGGGGGGGRVKLLYLDGMQDTASVRISGGRAGLGWATGIVGQDGSVHRGTTPETMTTIQFSASDPPLY